MRPASQDGRVDGITDATHDRPCDPFGRFIAAHGDRPGREWPTYRDAYVDGFRLALSTRKACA